jgi:hypothetical protein
MKKKRYYVLELPNGIRVIADMKKFERQRQRFREVMAINPKARINRMKGIQKYWKKKLKKVV